MTSSFIRTMDEAMKTLLYVKFATDMGLTNQTNDIAFAPKGVTQRNIAEKRGESQMEFIGVWREGIQLDWERQRSPIARRGMYMAFGDVGKTTIVNAKAVPAKINYSVYFWSKSLDKVSHAAETYLFWLHSNPAMTLNYNGLYPMQMYMSFGGVVDESPIDQMYDRGLYFVYKVPITLEGWIVELDDVYTVLSIYLDVWYTENLDPLDSSNAILLFSQVIVGES